MDDAILLHIDIHQYYNINEYYHNTYTTCGGIVIVASTGRADRGHHAAEGA